MWSRLLLHSFQWTGRTRDVTKGSSSFTSGIADAGLHLFVLVRCKPLFSKPRSCSTLQPHQSNQVIRLLQCAALRSPSGREVKFLSSLPLHNLTKHILKLNLFWVQHHTNMAAAPGQEVVVLDESIFSHTSPSPAFRDALLSLLWPPSGNQHPQQNPEEFGAYFVYFQQECRQDMANNHAMQTYADLAFILGIIRGNPSASLAGIRALIKNTNAVLASDERKLSLSIELVVRLWLMVSVKILMPQYRNDLDVSLPWPDDQSLSDILRRHISQPTVSHLSAHDKFSPYFNVVDMRNIANFRVLWTNNLADHLTMRGTAIYMFYHVSALKRLRSSVMR